MGRFTVIQNSSVSLTRVGTCTHGSLKTVLNMKLYMSENSSAEFYSHHCRRCFLYTQFQPVFQKYSSSAKVTRLVLCRRQHSFSMSPLWKVSWSVCSHNDLYTMEIFQQTYNFPLKNLYSPPRASCLYPSDLLTSLSSPYHTISMCHMHHSSFIVNYGMFLNVMSCKRVFYNKLST